MEGILKIANNCIQKFVDSLIAMGYSSFVASLYNLVPDEPTPQEFLLFLLRDNSTSPCMEKFGLQLDTRSKGHASPVFIVPANWKEII